MADGLSAVAAKALPRAMASGSWLGNRKPTPWAKFALNHTNPMVSMNRGRLWFTGAENRRGDLLFIDFMVRLSLFNALVLCDLTTCPLVFGLQTSPYAVSTLDRAQPVSSREQRRANASQCR